jgi:type IV secretory pathway VirB9-like protein
MHLQYLADQTYLFSTAVGSLTQIDFPAGEHVQHVVVSANPAVRVQQVGDTVQVSAIRADAVSGVNIITTRGTYRMQIASTHDSSQSTGFVHFGLPGAER